MENYNELKINEIINKELEIAAPINPRTGKRINTIDAFLEAGDNGKNNLQYMKKTEETNIPNINDDNIIASAVTSRYLNTEPEKEQAALAIMTAHEMNKQNK